METTLYIKFFFMGALLVAGILNLIAYSKVGRGAPLTGNFARIVNGARNRRQKNYWLYAIASVVFIGLLSSLGIGILLLFAAWAHWRLMKRLQAPALAPVVEVK